MAWRRSRVRDTWDKVGQTNNESGHKQKNKTHTDKAGFLSGTSVKVLLCGCVWRHKTVTNTYAYCSLLGLLRGDCIYREQIHMFTILNKNENNTNHLGGLQNKKLKRLSRSWELASLSPCVAQSYWGGVDYGAGSCHHNQHGIRQETKGPGVSFPETCLLIHIFDCHGQGCKEHIKL